MPAWTKPSAPAPSTSSLPPSWRRQGCGIGLALSRRLLREAGGNITLESHPGWRAGNRAPARLGEKQGETMQVLIIDDEPALRELLAATLTRAGHAADEKPAPPPRPRAWRGDVDLALCDIKLGDGNGVDLLQQPRRRHRYRLPHDHRLRLGRDRGRGAARRRVRLPGEAGAQRGADAPGGADRGGARPARREPARCRVVGDADSRMYRFTAPAMADVERLAARSRPPTARCSSRARAAPARA